MGNHMVDVPVITAIESTEKGGTSEWPALLFVHCKTEAGRFVVRMTGEAAHQLMAALTNNLPPKIGKVPPMQKL
jgi:hypothetical protein